MWAVRRRTVGIGLPGHFGLVLSAIGRGRANDVRTALLKASTVCAHESSHIAPAGDEFVTCAGTARFACTQSALVSHDLVVTDPQWRCRPGCVGFAGLRALHDGSDARAQGTRPRTSTSLPLLS